MGLISSLFVHKVVNVAVADEPNDTARRRTLLQSVNVDPEAPVDPRYMVADTDYYALCEKVTREDGHGCSVPLRVGASMRCDDYGAFGLAWKTALNLRGSYARAERYGKVLTSVSTYELRAEGGRLFMTLHRAGERSLGLRLSNEQTITAITQISREVCGQAFSPEAVYFKHNSPGDVTAHEDYFGCPVRYAADRDALQVSDDILEAPNRLGDAGVSRFFDLHLEQELSELADDRELAQRVRIQISQALSQGVPNVSDIAGRLGMSARTLQRRLADKDYTFQALVDGARRELAERLLRGTDYSLAEIAFLTGFSEQSAFTRAFKRWAGQTPRSFRLTAQPQ
ncbi:MAG: AraC family transcriptional regulator ligand-binding domain-containing protein [Pseudomonadota bacterium]